jgi:hypothetical protein
MVIKSRRVRLARHVAEMGKMGNTYKFLFEEAEGKILFGRLR